MEEFIRVPHDDEEPNTKLELFKFNDLNDHDIDVTPAAIWEELNSFNVEAFDS